MARRIEIELTSKLEDGRYTWRAAGAREPRGTVFADLVPPSVKLGEVLRAEVESGLDGVDVLSIVPRKEASPLDLRGESIERIAPPQPETGVQVTLASKGRGRGRDSERSAGRDDRGPRGPRGPKDRDRSTQRPAGPRGERAPGPRGERPTGPRTERSGPRPERAAGPRTERTADARGERPASRSPASRSSGDGRPRPPREAARAGDGRTGDGRSGGDRRGGAGRDARRTNDLPVSTTHRNALLATLRPEQLAVAEQLLRGGLPAVRQAIDEQNRAALAQGRPTVAPETILTIADDLLPLTSLAAWKDRASAVQHAGPSVRLRDLRPVVTSARTVTLDEEGRTVLKELQGQLHTKLDELRTQWVAKVTSLLERGDVVEALRVVARPPDSATRCPAELAAALTQAAGKALDAELTPTAWIVVLDAVVESPMRRTVHPAGIPAAEEAQAAAVRAAGHVPALAKLLGMRIPPPPPPTSAKRPAFSGRRSS